MSPERLELLLPLETTTAPDPSPSPELSWRPPDNVDELPEEIFTEPDPSTSSDERMLTLCFAITLTVLDEEMPMSPPETAGSVVRRISPPDPELLRPAEINTEPAVSPVESPVITKILPLDSCEGVRTRTCPEEIALLPLSMITAPPSISVPEEEPLSR
jgi:hypothetical protein